MMMFGTQLDEITDVQVFKYGFSKLMKFKNHKKKSRWNTTELELIKQLDQHLKAIKDTYTRRTGISKSNKKVDFNFLAILKEFYSIFPKIFFSIENRDNSVRYIHQIKFSYHRQTARMQLLNREETTTEQAGNNY